MGFALFAGAAHAGTLVWAVGNNGTILHTADGGSTWSNQTSGTAQRIDDLAFLDATPAGAIDGLFFVIEELLLFFVLIGIKHRLPAVLDRLVETR